MIITRLNFPKDGIIKNIVVVKQDRFSILNLGIIDQGSKDFVIDPILIVFEKTYNVGFRFVSVTSGSIYRIVVNRCLFEVILEVYSNLFVNSKISG